jgi:hypothetical protein
MTKQNKIKLLVLMVMLAAYIVVNNKVMGEPLSAGMILTGLAILTPLTFIVRLPGEKAANAGTTRAGLIRLVLTFAALCGAAAVLFDTAIPSGVMWKIAAASVGALIALSLFALSVTYRKK